MSENEESEYAQDRAWVNSLVWWKRWPLRLLDLLQRMTIAGHADQSPEAFWEQQKREAAEKGLPTMRALDKKRDPSDPPG